MPFSWLKETEIQNVFRLAKFATSRGSNIYIAMQQKQMGICAIIAALHLATFLFGAFGAKPFQYIVDACEAESVGQRNNGHGKMLEAEGAVAGGAKEMGVLVFHRAVAVIVAHVIFKAARTVIDSVYEPMKQEERKRA